MRQFVNATVPFNVTVVLQLLLDDAISNDSRERTIQDLLDQVATIWKLSLLDFADTAFVDRSDVSVWDADLDVVQKEPSPPQQQNNLLLQHRQARILWRKRRAQNANDDFLEVNVLGGLDIAVDELTLSPEAFVGRAETELESSFFSADELQRALDDDVAENGNSLPLAVVSEVPPPDLTDGDDESDRDTSESPSDKPSTASIVLGFTLLAATLVSLMFWSHVLWKKYKKEKRKRHLDSLRQAQSVTYQTERSSAALSMQQQNKRSQKEHQKQQIEQHMPIRTVTSEGSASSAYPGLATSDDDNEIERELDDDISSTLSDQFARELQLAASFDRATWGEVQRKKKLLKIQNGEPRSTTLVSSSIGIANARNVHMFGAMGSEDMGLEVEPQTGVSSYQGSFPYGDENARNNLSKLAPMRLDADNAVKWTATGVSQAAAAHATTNGTMKERSLKNETKPFSPYGEEKEKEVRRLEKSWDLDTYPVKDERVPLQYSFLHPLRGRALNEDVPDARHSPSSEASVHESLEVTSVGTNADSSVQEAMRSTTGKEKDDVESESAVTESMLKEIEEIANYVKNYEKQKQYRKSESKEIHSSDDSGRPLNVLSGSRSIQTIQYKVMNDSISLQAAAESLSMALPPPRTSPVHVRSLQSKRSEESSPNAFSDVEEDDSSQRLGISRISVEKPPGHLLSYKSSQDDPLQYNLSSLESGSLFPSSDIDSLRYSPSHSFERQTSNVPMTSLLDGPSHRLSADESEDDNGPMPLTVGRNVADILRDLGTNPSEFSLPHPSARDARRGVDFRSHGNDRSKQPTQQQQQQQHHYDSDDEGFNNVSLPPSSTIRSKDQNFNHIRSYFEANRTPPIVPPNESVSG